MATPALWIPGDIAIVTFGHGHNSIPGLASGLTAIGSGGSQSGGPLGIRTGYRVLQHGDDDSSIGTFSSSASANLRSWAMVIYRGQHTSTPIGKINGSGGTTGTVTYPALTAPLDGGSTSWVLGIVHGNDGPASLDTAPSGMTNRGRHDPASTDETTHARHDTNGMVSSWASTDATTTINNWQSQVVELRAAASGSLQFVTFWSADDNDVTLPPRAPADFTAQWV